MINILSVIAFVLLMVNHALMALVKLKAVYVISILSGLCLTALNLLLAFDGSQAGVALLAIPSAWMVVTSSIGLRKIWDLDRFVNELKKQGRPKQT